MTNQSQVCHKSSHINIKVAQHLTTTTVSHLFHISLPSSLPRTTSQTIMVTHSNHTTNHLHHHPNQPILMVLWDSHHHQVQLERWIALKLLTKQRRRNMLSKCLKTKGITSTLINILRTSRILSLMLISLIIGTHWVRIIVWLFQRLARIILFQVGMDSRLDWGNSKVLNSICNSNSNNSRSSFKVD